MEQSKSNFKTVMLKQYLKPLYNLANSDPALFNDIKQEVSVFIEENKDTEVHEYIDRARNKFGTWIELADRSYMIDKISSIETKMKFFFILTIVSMVLAALVAIATIK